MQNGSIPACAGEPQLRRELLRQWGVYPRVCGGTARRSALHAPKRGLSPRVRGNPVADALPAGPSRSIPACAGEPPSTTSRSQRRRVYPRVCGGTAEHHVPEPAPQGLSPRVRGNPLIHRGEAARNGSIPACAGEPCSAAASPRATTVYPRVCGGTARGINNRPTGQGLSPRVRGNRADDPRRGLDAGSIPACAGEPDSTYPNAIACWVYPRVCGGTGIRCLNAATQSGLSPRVRGNLIRAVAHHGQQGSIPACAGEPIGNRSQKSIARVYPRVCGGTRAAKARADEFDGLSPRVRGNRQLGPHPQRHRRSIPACAGEPGRQRLGFQRCWVYPRVCGGTNSVYRRNSDRCGLSPRVRGNPRRPRNCSRPDGLSPRVRGNRRVGHLADGAQRSIPACAGEPRTTPGAPPSPRVYPRVCGGTQGRHQHVLHHQGLSPRVRGNLLRARVHVLHARSIPACAGEPS